MSVESLTVMFRSPLGLAQSDQSETLGGRCWTPAGADGQSWTAGVDISFLGVCEAWKNCAKAQMCSRYQRIPDQSQMKDSGPCNFLRSSPQWVTVCSESPQESRHWRCLWPGLHSHPGTPSTRFCWCRPWMCLWTVDQWTWSRCAASAVPICASVGCK